MLVYYKVNDFGEIVDTSVIPAATTVSTHCYRMVNFVVAGDVKSSCDYEFLLEITREM